MFYERINVADFCSHLLPAPPEEILSREGIEPTMKNVYDFVEGFAKGSEEEVLETLRMGK